jgi:hypothetical protein
LDFIKMDCRAHYERLMERARGRNLSGYSERHHVLPKCLGGKDSAANVVRLTPEEHYVAHQLLVKMHPGNHSLLWAASNMTGKTGRMQRRNKLYGWLRRRLSEEMRGRKTGSKHSEETKAKMRAAKLGRKHSAETKAKMSASISIGRKGMKFSPEHRAALAAAKVGKKRQFSDEHRARLAAANRVSHLTRDQSGHKTQAYREAQSRKATEAWALRKSSITSTAQP